MHEQVDCVPPDGNSTFTQREKHVAADYGRTKHTVMSIRRIYAYVVSLLLFFNLDLTLLIKLGIPSTFGIVRAGVVTPEAALGRHKRSPSSRHGAGVACGAATAQR